MTPESTSPVPAVASAGAPPGEIATPPPGCRDQRVVALEHDDRPRARGRRPRVAQPVRADLARLDAEQAAELAGVRGEHRRRASGAGTSCARERVEAVGVEHQRHLDALAQLARERPRAVRAPEAGPEHDRVGPLDGSASAASRASVPLGQAA